MLATSPALEGIGGRYFNDCNEAPTVDHRDADGIGVASYALGPANADRLWHVSESLLQRASAIVIATPSGSVEISRAQQTA